MTAAFAQRCPDITYVDQSFQSTQVEVFPHTDEARQLFGLDPAVTSCKVLKSRALELFGIAETNGLIVSEGQPAPPAEPLPSLLAHCKRNNRNN